VGMVMNLGVTQTRDFLISFIKMFHIYEVSK
jgi:hypothetical protein